MLCYYGSNNVAIGDQTEHDCVHEWTHARGVRVISYLLIRHTLAHPTAHIVRGAEAILGGLGAQVHHLVEAELAAIDWCCFRF